MALPVASSQYALEIGDSDDPSLPLYPSEATGKPKSILHKARPPGDYPEDLSALEG